MEIPTVNTFIPLSPQNSRKRDSLPIVPSDRRIVAPAFGRWLTAQRGRRMPNDVVAEMHRAAVSQKGFTRAQLDRYEQGRTPRPDPAVLVVLAEIYGADLLAGLRVLAEEREQRALKRRGQLEESPPREHPPARRIRSGHA